MLSTTKFLAIITVPIFTGTFSFCSCLAAIICMKAKLRSLVRTRIVFIFSIYACIYSFSSILSVSMLPAETSDYAVGNLITCDIQGFLQQLGGLGCILYNLSLAIYYFAAIKWQMKERDIAKKVEPWIHVVPNGFAIASATFLSAKSPYAPLPEKHICWIGAYPQDCLSDPDVECVRGGKMAPIYAEFLAVIPFFVAYLLVSTIMMTIVHTIVKQKRKGDRWRMRDKPLRCGSLFKTSAGQVGKVIKRKRRFVLRKIEEAKNAHELANAIAVDEFQQSLHSKCVQLTNEDKMTQSEHRLIIAAASRSGKKEHPLSFDIRQVKQKIRRESNLARDAPIVLSSSKNSSIAKGNTPLRSKTSSERRNGTKYVKADPIHQCLLYMASFLVCFLFPAIARIYGILGKESPFALLLLARTFTPLNGLLLILVYSRPEVKSLRSRNQNLTWLGALVITFKAGFDNRSPYCVDEEGIDASRLPEAERQRRQEIVRQQYKRKSITQKQASGPIERKNDLVIPQGYSLKSDKAKETKYAKNNAVSLEGVDGSIIETKPTKSDIEAGDIDAEKEAPTLYDDEV